MNKGSHALFIHISDECFQELRALPHGTRKIIFSMFADQVVEMIRKTGSAEYVAAQILEKNIRLELHE